MHYEVEQKLRVLDLARVREGLRQSGAEARAVCSHSDTYFRHPARDFAVTDEAFRLRRVDDSGTLTYKGPKLDATTKTRVERETRLAPGAANLTAAEETLRLLGFEPVTTVTKRRETWALSCEGRAVEVALDEVEHVGSFVELELGVEIAQDDAPEPTLSAARSVLAAAIARLGLSAAPVERRSYLELLLSSSGLQPGGDSAP